jgi:hypothetical protein
MRRVLAFENDNVSSPIIPKNACVGEIEKDEEGQECSR